jgi:hypothetical protein
VAKRATILAAASCPYRALHKPNPRVEGSIRNATALRVKRVCFTRFSREEAKGGRNKCPSSTGKYDINVTSAAMQFPELRQQMQRVGVKLDLNEDCSIPGIGISARPTLAMQR